MGLPEEFAFTAVYRMTGNTSTKNWNLWQMQDMNRNEQLAVRLNGESLSVEFSYRTQENRVMTVLFPHQTHLFDSQWHKILLAVKKGSVSVKTDCSESDSQQLAPRGRVNLDGFTLIGKLKHNPAIAVTVSIMPDDVFTHKSPFQCFYEAMKCYGSTSDMVVSIKLCVIDFVS